MKDAGRPDRSSARVDALRQFFDSAVLGIPPAMIAMAFVVGIVGGLVGAGYLWALHLLQNWLWPTNWEGAIGFAVLGGAGLWVVVVTRVFGRFGDVELLVDNIHVSGGAPSVRALRSLIPSSLVCIAAGGGAGPEAPLVTTTGTLAGWLARKRHLAVVDTRSLTIAGMAAGFTVLFGAPLGSALFSLELLHRRGLQYYEALIPSIIGALSGYGIYVLVTSGTGLAPVWHLDIPARLHAVDLAWSVAAGVVGAIVAVLFTYMNLFLRRVFRRMPRSGRPVAGGLILAALGLWSSYALTFGEAQTTHVIGLREVTAAALLIAVVAKLIGTSVTISSGWPGGFIIPLFFIGENLGRAFHIGFPSATEAVMAAALMAAINCGVTKTPLGSTLVVTEMAGFRLLPTTMIASLVGFLLTSHVGLIESQRERQSTLDESEAGVEGVLGEVVPTHRRPPSTPRSDGGEPAGAPIADPAAAAEGSGERPVVASDDGGGWRGASNDDGPGHHPPGPPDASGDATGLRRAGGPGVLDGGAGNRNATHRTGTPHGPAGTVGRSATTEPD